MWEIMMYSKESVKSTIKKFYPSLLIILLIPLLPALIWVLYEIKSTPTPMQLQLLMRFIIFGSPVILLIYYAHITGNKIFSILVGMSLFPLIFFYAEIIGELIDPHPGRIWTLIKPSFLFGLIIDVAPIMVLHGLIGYFASKRTKINLLASIVLFMAYLFIMINID